MKSVPHRHATEARREPFFAPRYEDPYLDSEKPAQNAHCPECGAVYRKGRWAWGPVPRDSIETCCSACLRIQDSFPGGYVTLRGPFVEAHREELRRLVEAREAQEKAEHPLERLMDIADRPAALEITTTGIHLARAIGNAVQEAYEGSLRLRYQSDENLVRAVWTR